MLAPWPATPMAYLFGDGDMARSISPLLQGLLAIAILVAAIVSALVIVGAWRQRSALALADTPIDDRPAIAWIGIGVGVSTAVLVGLIVWSTVTMATISRPSQTAAFTIAITAHRWWWEATYRSGDTDQNFSTANEIHIPVGAPVRFTLASADLIHSFWVPALGGKTDVIPGQTNVTWLKADHAGSYRGQCSEYCGAQHAHMAFTIVADPPAAFESWRAAQAKPAAIAQDKGALDGEAVFQQRCSKCHAIRGSRADGDHGPDLTHVMSRARLAAGAIPNNAGWLSAWIADPQHIKPGSLMPKLPLSGRELADVRDYLLTLK